MKKIITLVCCLCLILSVFTCCKKSDSDPPEPTVAGSTQEQQTENTKENKNQARGISLSYNAKQPFNPYKTKSTANKNIATLLYDSLFRLDSGYNAVALLASEYTLNGKTLTVTLGTELFFSDGSPVTVSDVIASFRAAKKSPVYASRLKNITSAASTDGQSISFALKRANIYAVNCLDFPVAKAETVNDSIPTGSGRYILKKSKGSYLLTANENNTRHEALEQEKIALYPADAQSGELYQLQIGDISFMFDDMSRQSEKKKISAGTVDIPLNILVYLGFNNTGLFADKNLKKAVEAAVDVNLICSTAYNSLAEPVSGIFNPEWSVLSAVSPAQPKQQTALAEQLLEKSGYIYAYENNRYRSKNFDFIEMTVLVNEESEEKTKAAGLVASFLKNVGIDARVDKVAFDEYKKRLSSGEYDLYIGEIKLTPDMDLSVFFSEGGQAAYSVDNSSTAAKAYYDFAQGKIDNTTFCKVFDEDKPVLPIGYRYGVAYYSRELKYEGTVSESDVFANIYSWSFS